MQLLGQIPVEQRDEGRDARLEQVVDKLGIVVDSQLVDGVVAAALGDDSGPGDGEAVGLCSKRLEQGNVLGGAVVRVAGRDAGRSIGNLAGDGAKGVPDAGASAVLVDGAFNLVAVEVCV